MSLIKLPQLIACIFIFVVVFGTIPAIWGQKLECKALYPVPNGIIEPPYGYINCLGKVVVPMKYDMAFDFNDGVAVAVRGNDSELHFLNGRMIEVSGVRLVTNFSEGLAIGKRGKRYVLINKAGKVTAVLPKKVKGLSKTYDNAGNFSEGLVRVSVAEGTHRFIDRRGKFVFDHKNQDKDILKGVKYEYVQVFSEGLAAVYFDGKWGYIDKCGREIIPLKYEDADRFSEGMAAVSLNGREYGFIDKLGNFVIPPSMLSVASYPSGFKNGLVYVWKKDSGDWFEGYIDKAGKWVWKTNQTSSVRRLRHIEKSWKERTRRKKH